MKDKYLNFIKIQVITSIIFVILIAFIMGNNNIDIVYSVIRIYGIVWIPSILISTNLYNKIILEEDEKSDSE